MNQIFVFISLFFILNNTSNIFAKSVLISPDQNEDRLGLYSQIILITHKSLSPEGEVLNLSDQRTKDADYDVKIALETHITDFGSLKQLQVIYEYKIIQINTKKVLVLKSGIRRFVGQNLQEAILKATNFFSEKIVAAIKT